MDINTPMWEAAGTIHRQEACALMVVAKAYPWGDAPRQTTYGDVVSTAKGPIQWCPACGVEGNPAASGLVAAPKGDT